MSVFGYTHADPKGLEAISAGKLAENLLGYPDPNADTLIEKLSSNGGQESEILEYKASLRPLPGDASTDDECRWNVVKAILSMANSHGGCILLGIAEDNDTKMPYPAECGCDPDGILTNGHEIKDLLAHTKSQIFGKSNIFHISESETIKFEKLADLKDLVHLYYCVCHRWERVVHVIAIIVNPIPDNNTLLGMTVNITTPSGTCTKFLYRQNVAETLYIDTQTELTKLFPYIQTRNPTDPKFTELLRGRSVPSFIFLPRRNENFIGRKKDLEEIRKLCDSGRIPIIHGEGGSGKTELAYEYAHRNAHRYGGGCFHVHMDGRKTWDEIFSALRAKPEIEKWLKYRASEFKPIESSIEDFNPIAAALVNKLVFGDILIVLDNLNSVSLFPNNSLYAAFPRTGFIGAHRIHIVVTTRNLDYDFSRESNLATPYELTPLDDTEAFALLTSKLPNKDSLSDEDKSFAKQIATELGNHPWRLEITGSYLAQNSSCLSLESYLTQIRNRGWGKSQDHRQKTLRDNPLTPEELLQPTLKQLNDIDGEGNPTVTLAKIISLFPLIGVTRAPLRFIWENYFKFPKYDIDGRSTFNLAIQRLKQYSILAGAESLNRLKMHQLTRDAFRAFTNPEFQDSISKALSEDPGCPLSYWTVLAKDKILMSHCPWEHLGNGDYSRIVINNPEYADRIIWDKIDGYNLHTIFCKQPDLSKMIQSFDKLYIYNANERYTAFAKLLAEQPSFAEKCDFTKLKRWDIAYILSRQPQLLPYCEFRLKDFIGTNWVTLLSAQSQFADKCKWDALTFDNWVSLIAKVPTYADCNEFTSRFSLKGLKPNQWAWIIGEHPDFFANRDDCPATTIGNDPEAASLLISWVPEFAEDNSAERARFKFNFSKFESKEWLKILKAKPQALKWLCDRYNGWKKLSGKDWTTLLIFQPHFSEYCDFTKLNGYDWSRLLKKRPEMATKEAWATMASQDREDFFSPLVSLLYANPKLSPQCSLDSLSISGKRLLLSVLPCMETEFKASEFPPHEWARLVTQAPTFAERCPFCQLDPLELAIIVRAQPQLRPLIESQIKLPELTNTLLALDDVNWIRRLQTFFIDYDTARMHHDERKLIISTNLITWNYYLQGLTDKAKFYANLLLKYVSNYGPALPTSQASALAMSRYTALDAMCMADFTSHFSLPDSGKSSGVIILRHAPFNTKARGLIGQISDIAATNKLSVRTISANPYSIEDNRYTITSPETHFDDLIGQLSDSIKGGGLTFIDTPCIHSWEALPIYQTAHAANIPTIIVNFQQLDSIRYPEGPEQELTKEFHSHGRLLCAENPTGSQNPKEWIWDPASKILKESTDGAAHFKYDALISVPPMLFASTPIYAANNILAQVLKALA